MSAAQTQPTWAEILDQLEEHLEAAERLVGGVAAEALVEWEIPAVDVPIPGALVPRAQALFARQQQAIAQIPAVLAETGARLRTTTRVSRMQGRQARPAVYLDVSV